MGAALLWTQGSVLQKDLRSTRDQTCPRCSPLRGCAIAPSALWLGAHLQKKRIKRTKHPPCPARVHRCLSPWELIPCADPSGMTSYLREQEGCVTTLARGRRPHGAHEDPQPHRQGTALGRQRAGALHPRGQIKEQMGALTVVPRSPVSHSCVQGSRRWLCPHVTGAAAKCSTSGTTINKVGKRDSHGHMWFGLQEAFSLTVGGKEWECRAATWSLGAGHAELGALASLRTQGARAAPAVNRHAAELDAEVRTPVV